MIRFPASGSRLPEAKISSNLEFYGAVLETDFVV
jgi:hypothetical protein